jgi:hypothetical protein
MPLKKKAAKKKKKTTPLGRVANALKALPPKKRAAAMRAVRSYAVQSCRAKR